MLHPICKLVTIFAFELFVVGQDSVQQVYQTWKHLPAAA